VAVRAATRAAVLADPRAVARRAGAARIPVAPLAAAAAAARPPRAARQRRATRPAAAALSAAQPRHPRQCSSFRSSSSWSRSCAGAGTSPDDSAIAGARRKATNSLPSRARPPQASHGRARVSPQRAQRPQRPKRHGDSDPSSGTLSILFRLCALCALCGEESGLARERAAGAEDDSAVAGHADHRDHRAPSAP